MNWSISVAIFDLYSSMFRFVYDQTNGLSLLGFAFNCSSKKLGKWSLISDIRQPENVSELIFDFGNLKNI